MPVYEPCVSCVWFEEFITMQDKTEQEWRELLDAHTYHITREGGTERPFTGEYLHLDANGVFNCVCCQTPLFSSDTKYDSGSGWPSFYDVLHRSEERRVGKDGVASSLPCS